MHVISTGCRFVDVICVKNEIRHLLYTGSCLSNTVVLMGGVFGVRVYIRILVREC